MQINKILKEKIEKKLGRLLKTDELGAVFKVSSMHKEGLEEALEDEAEEFYRAIKNHSNKIKKEKV